MNKDEIILLKDAMINAIIEISQLKDKLKNSEESSMFWYKKFEALEKEVRDEDPNLQPEPLDETVEISKEL